MKVIAKGKDEVLKYLEADARERTGGQEGLYMIQSDGLGMVAFIAGHTFSGSGTIRNKLEGKIDIKNGIAVKHSST